MINIHYRAYDMPRTATFDGYTLDEIKAILYKLCGTYVITIII
jgi:hypothetical protein